MRDRVPGSDDLSGHAISQEDVAKLVLDRLDTIAASDPEFDDLLATFIPTAREHIAFEEDEAWPPLRQVLNAAEAAQLGDKIADALRSAARRLNGLAATPASAGPPASQPSRPAY